MQDFLQDGESQERQGRVHAHQELVQEVAFLQRASERWPEICLKIHSRAVDGARVLLMRLLGDSELFRSSLDSLNFVNKVDPHLSASQKTLQGTKGTSFGYNERGILQFDSYRDVIPSS